MLLRLVTTLIGVTARMIAALSPASGPQTRRTRPVEQGDGEDPGEGLREEDTPAAEAEELGARRLEPEAQRRLIDRDEAARIERDEEEVAPAQQHTLDGGGVVLVRVALIAETDQVEHRRDGDDQRQRHPFKRREAACPLVGQRAPQALAKTPLRAGCRLCGSGGPARSRNCGSHSAAHHTLLAGVVVAPRWLLHWRGWRSVTASIYRV